MESAPGIQTAVTVRIKPDYDLRMEDVVAGLKAAGLKNVEPRPRFSIVSGDVDIRRLSDLSSVEGVASVREDQTYKAQDR